MAISRIALTKIEGYPGVPTIIPVAGVALATVTSGDLVIGDGAANTPSTSFVGIAQSDYLNATTPIGFMIEGCVELAVHSESAASVNQVTCIGDPLYYSAQTPGTGQLDHGPGTYVGRALEYIATGAEATIKVLLSPRTAPAISDDTVYSVMTFPIQLVGWALNTLPVDGVVLGFAGTILKHFFVCTVDATNAADVEFTPTIAGTPTTGGMVALTHTLCVPGDTVDSAAPISAANAFTAVQEINIKATEADTPFQEGAGVFVLVIGTAHDHS
jgi:hypothetical protein